RGAAVPEKPGDERGGGGGGIVEVPRHDGRRADLEFADSSGQAQLRRLGYAERDAVRWTTDRAACGGLILGPHAEIAGARLGQTEQIEKVHVWQEDRQLFRERRAEGIAAGRD